MLGLAGWLLWRQRMALAAGFTAIAVQTVGYYTSSVNATPDGGGAIYSYDSTDTTTADNAGTVIVDAAGRRWKMLRVGYAAPEQFGAKGDGTTDDTAALQRMLNQTPLAALTPNRTYLVSSKTTVGTETGFLFVPNSTTITGPRSATIKVGNNVGDYTAVFLPQATSGNPVSEVIFNDFTIDQNAAGNTTCNITPGNIAKTCGAIIFQRVNSHVYAERLRIINAPGVNTISFNGSGSVDIRVNKNEISFLAGTSTTTNYDNSAVYIEAVDYQCNENWVYNTSVSGGGTYEAGRTAVEVHGSHGSACNNKAFRFQTVMNVVGHLAGQDIPDIGAISVDGNESYQCRSGIALWALTGSSLKGFSCNNNKISLNPTLFADSPSVSCGVTLITAAGAAGDFKAGNILNNIIEWQGNVQSANLANRSAGINIDTAGTATDITVKGNKVYNSPCNGISVFQQTGAFTRIEVDENLVVNAGQNASSTIRYGVLWRGVVTNSKCRNNTCRDTASTLVMQGGTSTNFLGAGSDIITGNNICESPNSTTLLRNTGGQYDLPMGYAPVVVAGATHTLNPQVGASRFIDTISVTTGVTMAIITSSYGQASFSEIAVELINTSGGTTAITWTSSFVFQTAFTQMTSGQRSFLKFAYDGATAKWYQAANQITVTS